MHENVFRDWHAGGMCACVFGERVGGRCRMKVLTSLFSAKAFLDSTEGGSGLDG